MVDGLEAMGLDDLLVVDSSRGGEKRILHVELFGDVSADRILIDAQVFHAHARRLLVDDVASDERADDEDEGDAEDNPRHPGEFFAVVEDDGQQDADEGNRHQDDADDVETAGFADLLGIGLADVFQILVDGVRLVVVDSGQGRRRPIRLRRIRDGWYSPSIWSGSGFLDAAQVMDDADGLGFLGLFFRDGSFRLRLAFFS